VITNDLIDDINRMDAGRSRQVGPGLPLPAVRSAGRVRVESWERNVWALALVVFIAFVGFQFFCPSSPLYVIELGVTDPTHVALWSGMLTAVTPAGLRLLGPLWGSFADGSAAR
jgi:hypothetical protein